MLPRSHNRFAYKSTFIALLFLLLIQASSTPSILCFIFPLRRATFSQRFFPLDVVTIHEKIITAKWVKIMKLWWQFFSMFFFFHCQTYLLSTSQDSSHVQHSHESPRHLETNPNFSPPTFRWRESSERKTLSPCRRPNESDKSDKARKKLCSVELWKMKRNRINLVLTILRSEQQRIY